MLAIFKEVLDYAQTKTAVCDACCPGGAAFVRIARCRPGATGMCERMLASLYGRREILSRRYNMLSQRACSSSGLRQGLQLTAQGAVNLHSLLLFTASDRGSGYLRPHPS